MLQNLCNTVTFYTCERTKSLLVAEKESSPMVKLGLIFVVRFD